MAVKSNSCFIRWGPCLGRGISRPASSANRPSFETQALTDQKKASEMLVALTETVALPRGHN